MKICLLRAELFHAGRREEVNSRFWQFYRRTYKFVNRVVEDCRLNIDI